MKAVLKSYIDVQQCGGITDATVMLGNVTKQVNIKVPCRMILGDMQGGDKHCCSSIGYSKNQA